MNWDNKAFIFTAVFYTIVLFLFLFLGFTTPLPLPAEEGILINFGDTETGFGEREPRPVEEVINTPEAVQPVSQEITEQIEEQLTQDYEEAPEVVPVKREETKPTDNKTPEKKPEEEVKPVKEPTVNPSAMYTGRKPDSQSSSSEGESGGSGNEGNLAGDVDATSHSLGAGTGDGISFSLNGRSPVRLPLPDFNTQKEGRVVVRVRVDRTGKIIK